MNAIFNVDAALRFAKVLEEEAHEVRAHNAAVSRTLVELQASWRDKKYDAFVRTFDDATLSLAKCLEQCEHYSEHLRKKAAIVRQHYLKD